LNALPESIDYNKQENKTFISYKTEIIRLFQRHGFNVLILNQTGAFFAV